MNRQPIMTLLLLTAAAACAACDRRESTGTSDVARKGQGEVPEAARDARETSTHPTDPTSRGEDVPPPPEDQAPEKQTQAEQQTDPSGDATTERDEGDTLHRP
jgi:hypothetical protein